MKVPKGCRDLQFIITETVIILRVIFSDMDTALPFYVVFTKLFALMLSTDSYHNRLNEHFRPTVTLYIYIYIYIYQFIHKPGYISLITSKQEC